MEEIEDKLLRVLGDSFALAEKNIIIDTDDTVHAFGCYSIGKHTTGSIVTKNQNVIGMFSSQRLALSWCIADKCNQYQLADNILRLDRDFVRINNDLVMSKKQVDRLSDPIRREIMCSKISHKQSLLTSLDLRLKKCVSVAKYWQLKGFHDEIARTRRPAPNPTNRSRDPKSVRKKSPLR